MVELSRLSGQWNQIYGQRQKEYSHGAYTFQANLIDD